MKKIYQVISALLLLLGFTHSIATLFFFNDFSEEAIWFALAGLALVFAGFLNIANLSIESKMLLAFTRISNCLLLLLTSLLLFVLSGFMVFLVFSCVLLATLSSFTLVGSSQ